MNRYKIAIVASHPVQYHCVYYRELSKHTDLMVYYAHQPERKEQGEGFGCEVAWDVDLLSGYKYEFVPNIAEKKSVSRFSGCDTPTIKQKIQQSRYDCVILNGWYLKAYLQAACCCRTLKVPILIRGDSHRIETSHFFKTAIKKISYRIFLKQFDGFLSVGMLNRAYLRYFGITNSKIFHAPHHVDVE